MSAAVRASREPPSWRLITLLGVLSAFPPMSIDLYLPSLPTISRTFHRPVAEASFTVVAFLAGVCLGQLGYGPVSDRWGRRGPLLGGIALYILASLGCAFAPSLELLILFRLLQALGGCAALIIPRAVVRDRWQGDEVARIFSMLVLIYGLAPLLAPLLGGLLLTFGGWRSIFGVLTAFGVMSGTWVFIDLRESRSPEVAVHAQ